MEYRETYGEGLRKVVPDRSRCAAAVMSQWGTSQCRNKARFDPDENGNPTTCGVHCEAAVAERERKAKEETEKAIREYGRRKLAFECLRFVVEAARTDDGALGASCRDFLKHVNLEELSL